MSIYHDIRNVFFGRIRFFKTERRFQKQKCGFISEFPLFPKKAYDLGRNFPLWGQKVAQSDEKIGLAKAKTTRASRYERAKGRPVGVPANDRQRATIQVARILAELQKCLDGKRELTPVQMTAAQTLLKKALPDLTSVEVSGQTDHSVTVVHRLE